MRQTLSIDSWRVTGGPFGNKANSPKVVWRRRFGACSPPEGATPSPEDGPSNPRTNRRWLIREPVAVAGPNVFAQTTPSLLTVHRIPDGAPNKPERNNNGAEWRTTKDGRGSKKQGGSFSQLPPPPLSFEKCSHTYDLFRVFTIFRLFFRLPEKKKDVLCVPAFFFLSPFFCFLSTFFFLLSSISSFFFGL